MNEITKEQLDQKIKDCDKRMEKLTFRRQVAHTIRNTIVWIYIVIAVFSCAAHVSNLYHTAKIPTTESDISAKKVKLDRKTYAVSYKSGDRIDGIDFYDVTIGPEKIPIAKDQYFKIFGTNTKVTTEVYILSLHDDETYFMKFLRPDCMKVVRFSCLGQHDFTKSEINGYKKTAAKYLGKQKLEALKIHHASEEELSSDSLPLGMSYDRSFWSSHK